MPFLNFYILEYNMKIQGVLKHSLNKLIGGAIRYAYNNDMIIKDFSRSVVLPKEDKKVKKSRYNHVKPFSKHNFKRKI